MDGFLSALRTNIWVFAGIAIAALLFAPETWQDYLVGLLPPTYQELGAVSFILETLNDGPESILYRILLALIFVLAGLQLQFMLGNYAKYLPSHLHFEANFSEGRIEHELDLIPVAERERAGIFIEPNWREIRQAYLRDRNKQIQVMQPGCEFRFDNDTDGVGTFSFLVVKRSGSLQTYEANRTSFGVVDFHSQHLGMQRVLMARFLLQSDGKERFSVTKKEAFFPSGQGLKGMLTPSRYMIVRPMFSQMAYENLTSHTSIGTIVALTRVRYFPSVLLTSTIYLVDVSKTINTEPTEESVSVAQSKHFTPCGHGSTRFVPIACGIYEH